MQEPSDIELMLDVKSGDLDKLGILYKRYSRVLFKFIYNVVGNAEESEDLVQNVFYRMLKYRHTFKGDGAFLTWMYHLARNAMADQFRKNSKLGHKKELDDYANKIIESDPKEDDHQGALLNLALEKLTQDQKELLVLSKIQGLKYEEIGKILNCTEGTVKVRVHRAFNELKKVYLTLHKTVNSYQ